MSQKGISLIQLVVVIIILIILASMAVFSSSSLLKESRLERDYESLKSIKEATKSALTLIEINPDEYNEEDMFGNRIDAEAYYSRIGLDSPDDLSSRSYMIDESNQEALNLENITEERQYIVDLENEKYYVVDGVEREKGQRVYEYVDILKLYDVLNQ